MEMLEAGFGSVAEFHYLHHQPGGAPYADPAELAHRIAAAAADAGIGLTLLPVLYTYGGANAAPLAGGQLRFGNDLDAFLRFTRPPPPTFPPTPSSAPPRTPSAPPPPTSSPPSSPPSPTAPSTSTPPSRSRRSPTSRPGSAPAPSPSSSTASASPALDPHPLHPDDPRTRPPASPPPAPPPASARSPRRNLGDGIFPGAAYLAAGGTPRHRLRFNIRISLAEELRGLEYSQRLALKARNVLAAPGASVGATLHAAALAGGARALPAPAAPSPPAPSPTSSPSTATTSPSRP